MRGTPLWHSPWPMVTSPPPPLPPPPPPLPACEGWPLTCRGRRPDALDGNQDSGPLTTRYRLLRESERLRVEFLSQPLVVKSVNTCHCPRVSLATRRCGGVSDPLSLYTSHESLEAARPLGNRRGAQVPGGQIHQQEEVEYIVGRRELGRRLRSDRTAMFPQDLCNVPATWRRHCTRVLRGARTLLSVL
ncbi:uncharacterized protein LOC123517520 isoform X2 [Portunus trituberculatus]|uniref:uncharacterized protein LOC123517520 isoform X2 n=1 Tax=Portunus trituberculatus TaxID=210409 RepID=UPI001E1CBE23|nr:uncharacterized protein LOC123517520 isoform X2 [Portunus trituberculatus]